jgi:hypothetical protein
MRSSAPAAGGIMGGLGPSSPLGEASVPKGKPTTMRLLMI